MLKIDTGTNKTVSNTLYVAVKSNQSFSLNKKWGWGEYKKFLSEFGTTLYEPHFCMGTAYSNGGPADKYSLISMYFTSSGLTVLRAQSTVPDSVDGTATSSLNNRIVGIEIIAIL